MEDCGSKLQGCCQEEACMKSKVNSLRYRSNTQLQMMTKINK